MLVIRLPTDIESRLSSLAQKTGRSKSFYAREALEHYLEEMEDYYLAQERLRLSEKTWSQEEIERELGIDVAN